MRGRWWMGGRRCVFAPRVLLQFRKWWVSHALLDNDCLTCWCTQKMTHVYSYMHRHTKNTHTHSPTISVTPYWTMSLSFVGNYLCKQSDTSYSMQNVSHYTELWSEPTDRITWRKFGGCKSSLVHRFRALNRQTVNTYQQYSISSSINFDIFIWHKDKW